MFECIIYATDGSDHARKALAYARDLAKLHDAELFVVHAYPSVSDLLGYKEYDTVLAHRIADAKKIIEEAGKELERAGLTFQTELLEGPMAEAIMNVAETRGADLIVLGARGMSSLEGLLLGSVSQKVIHHATCPVLVVR
jgi:nucleotide-binding universal stress UspA family protein